MVSRWVQVCDLEHEGEVDDIPAAESVSFNVDGKTFELDLCSQHLIQWRAFEDQQDKWQRAARVQAAELAAPPRRSGRVSDSAEHRKENTAIREWAKTQPDIELGERGRIADSVRQRYRDAMGERARDRWTDATSHELNGAEVAVGASSA